MTKLSSVYDFSSFEKRNKSGKNSGFIFEDTSLGAIKNKLDNEQPLVDIDQADAISEEPVSDEKESKNEPSLDFGDVSRDELLNKLELFQGVITQYKKFLSKDNIKIDDMMINKIAEIYNVISK
jgi:hypothetical protein